MFDWGQSIKRYWPAIILSLALLLILDGTISSLETCHPPPNGPSTGQNSNENCTVLQGPLASFVIGLGHFFDTHDKGIVAAFTVILAISTILLWLATLNLYGVGKDQIATSRKIAALQARQTQRSIREAIRTAKAAEKSADAAVAVERACLYVVINHNFEGVVRSALTWENTPTVDQKVIAATESPMATVKFRNYGKTPAIVGEVELGFIYSETVPNDLVYHSRVVKENIIASDQVTEDFPLQMNGQMTIGMAKRMQKGWGNLWIYGQVFYEDVFSQRRVHRFLQRYIRISDYRFVLQAYDHEYYNRST